MDVFLMRQRASKVLAHHKSGPVFSFDAHSAFSSLP